MKLPLSLLLPLALLFCTEKAVAFESLPDIIDRVQHSILKITVTYSFSTMEKPKEKRSATMGGTGFIIDAKGDIATAGHLVGTAKLKEELEQGLLAQHLHLDPATLIQSQIFIEIVGRSKQGKNYDSYNVRNGFNAEVAAIDESTDVAVLRGFSNPLQVKASTFAGREFVAPLAVPILHLEPPRDGEQISASGFPLSIPILVTNTGWIASSYFRDERDRSLYLGSILINHGNSGAPVYLDSDGSIVGMVIEYRPAPEGNSGLTVILPIQRVIALLTTVEKREQVGAEQPKSR